MVEEFTIEGPWEEIAARAEEFAGRRVRLTLVAGSQRKVAGGLQGRQRWIDPLTLPEAQGESAERVAPKSIEEKIQERAAQIPDEEWDNLPADLLDRLDHYLYGTQDR